MVARERRLRVVGPSVHAYLDRDPDGAAPASPASEDPEVRRWDPHDLTDLRDRAVNTAAEGDGVLVQNCISAAAGRCDIDL